MARSASGSQASLREANRRRVLKALRAAGSLTQAELARQTGLSPATVSNIVRDLAVTGILDVRPTARGGRRAQAVSLSRGVGVAIGIDFGHRHLRMAVGDLSHEVIAERALALPPDHRAGEGLALAASLVDELLADAGMTRANVRGVGLGLPAPIDAGTGAVGSASILPGWVGVPAADVMRERLAMRVHVDNDANLGALGEVVWGAARGCSEAAYLKVATGIGAGLIIGGRLHRGVAGTAGEVGHTTIDEHGRVCHCGNRGCLETFVGAPHLLELLRTSHGPDLTLPGVIALAQEGDAGCRRVIADAGRHLGVAVANLCNLLNPERIVVGGEFAQAGDLLLDPIRDVVSRFAIPSAAAVLRVCMGVLGERAEVLGALALALSESDLPVG
jgi:predicted NBD/HSP70 family sugar kinase